MFASNSFSELASQIKRMYYSLQSALGITQSDIRANLNLRGDPVWLLGRRYESPVDALEEGHSETVAALMQHMQSILYMSYRNHFSPLYSPSSGPLTSDAGWGCTLRSGQMLLAQGLLKCAPSPSPSSSSSFCQVLKGHHIHHLFWDTPEQPFSLHSLCKHGQQWGVQPGKWLGPWVLCKTLESAVSSTSFLSCRTLGECGGGAPVLRPTELSVHLDRRYETSSEAPVILLVPLVLGIQTLNPWYIPQLQSVLEMPSCIGIVGGRPGSSLYFVGYQGQNLLYLDPHTVQQAALDESADPSFIPQAVKPLNWEVLDSSLALGFICRSQEDLDRLCESLSDLEGRYKSAPLVCVSDDVPCPLSEFGKEESEVGSAPEAAEEGAWHVL